MIAEKVGSNTKRLEEVHVKISFGKLDQTPFRRNVEERDINSVFQLQRN